MKTINPNLNQVLSGPSHKIREASWYINGIINNRDFVILAEAITLLESDNPDHQRIATDILIACEQVNTDSLRIGITGSPGVGKSTFIENITPTLLRHHHTAAVLTIDPSSIDNRGSILGDKTRMQSLSQNKSVFLRPSPSRKHLGGTHAMTFEAIIMCEAAGIELIIIETVGVGQSEHAITDFVDCVLLLLLPGAGDDLQGIKKGITQIADIIVIHKADGDQLQSAQKIARDYELAMHLSRSNDQQWQIPVCKHSSIDQDFKSKVPHHIERFINHLKDSKTLLPKRKIQRVKIMRSRLLQNIQSIIKHNIDADSRIQDTIESGQEHPYNTLSTLLNKLKLTVNWLE